MHGHFRHTGLPIATRTSPKTTTKWAVNNQLSGRHLSVFFLLKQIYEHIYSPTRQKDNTDKLYTVVYLTTMCCSTYHSDLSDQSEFMNFFPHSSFTVLQISILFSIYKNSDTPQLLADCSASYCMLSTAVNNKNTKLTKF